MKKVEMVLKEYAEFNIAKSHENLVDIYIEYFLINEIIAKNDQGKSDPEVNAKKLIIYKL